MNKFLLILLSSLLVSQGQKVAVAEALEATATIHGDRAQGTISKHIYGHFMEHLGRCIYDGLWVGEESSIPNTRGIRNDVIAALKDLNCPNLRWPGGCFADDYHWRDGIGPRDKRPERINIHWGGVIETNAFGTHEFLDLCEIIGADPYIAGNMGSGSPQEMRDWIEYMTFAGESELANERRANGREEPWKIPFFGVGNENWGCGGNMTPEFYSDLYKRFATFCRDFSGNHLMRVACGPNGGDDNWTKVVFSRVGGHAQALSLHYYTLAAPWHDKLSATGFGEDQWFGILRSTMRMDDILNSTEAIMNDTDPEIYRGLYVDEWGTWYQVEEGTNPGFLYQQNTLRDALVAGLNFHIFQKHHQRVRMCNIAQTVNVLQAMILTEGEKMLLTPTYYAFEMCKVHQDTKFLPVELETPEYKFGDAAIPAVSVSASRGDDGTVYVSFVNTHAHDSINLKCQLAGVDAQKVTGRVLSADSLDAHNTFDQPNQVEPREFTDVSLNDSTLSTTLPPHSLVVVTLSN
ncbi:alpha-N-arabinofuranosidase [Bythopirellula goksoeyrii]|uniref:non-reducing end alpha-L-arabinofuranosidase n=1 Tax=Bythopirellula goksoeyrii TaxID=1400387 RepID=A0A5B9QII4_9BACT|nr:alpha-N-arabinofuranosidase [Bythopirellula goksoeyrii]QEG37502.1 Intracellular exo-alpha-L-arabinofuranosidase 2 [Bythopirellula goksoeyrii]